MPDMQKLFVAHMKAQAEAQKWVEKAVELRDGGKERQAKAAEEKAKEWLRKAMKIEKRVKPKNPHGRD